MSNEGGGRARIVWGVIRVLAAAAIAAAVIAQFSNSLAVGVPDVGRFLVNFFSFFTILSNCLSVAVIAWGAVACFRRSSDTEVFTVARAAVVTYMATTGVVYNLLLRGISLDQGYTLPWSNEILHVWAPVYLVLDWVLAPGRRPIAWNRLWIVVAFPVVWVGYTMIRGPIADWYPYPFLNPAQPGGYGAVLLYVVAIAGFILLVGLGVAGLSRVPVPGDRGATAR